MSLFWISWCQPINDERPAIEPPNDRVLGWWRTGVDDLGSILCALVRAGDEDGARDVIRRDWPAAAGWRFCNQRETTLLSDRFTISTWMRERMEATSYGL